MLLAVQGCHACKLKDVATPGCDSLANTKKRRAIDPAMEVLFSLVVNSSSPGDDVEERSEAVLFQVQYAVATGQFQISLNGTNSTADRSSLQHLFSNVTCAAGSVTSADRKGCGKYCLFLNFYSGYGRTILRLITFLSERRTDFIENIRIIKAQFT